MIRFTSHLTLDHYCCNIFIFLGLLGSEALLVQFQMTEIILNMWP